jgi:hypothetical protein
MPSPTSANPAHRSPPKLSTAGIMVGLGRFELPTSRLSGVRSNQLSYRPTVPGIAEPASRAPPTPTESRSHSWGGPVDTGGPGAITRKHES